MADKIKILKINRQDQDEINAVTDKKHFSPIAEPWFEEETETSLTMDFDETQVFDLAKKKTLNNEPKITLIQNANSHFLKYGEDFEFNLNRADLDVKQFASIKVLDGQNIKQQSKLPENILNLRMNSYAKEQSQKDELLDKINNEPNCEVHLKNYVLTKQNSGLAKERIDEIRQSLIGNTPVSENLIKPAPTKNFKVEEASTIKPVSEFENSATLEAIPTLAPTPSIKPKAVANEQTTNTGDIKDIFSNFEKKISNNPKKGQTQTHEVDLLNTTTTDTLQVQPKPISEELFQKIETELSSELANKNKSTNDNFKSQTSHRLNTSFLDYTVSDKTDDMEREVAKRTKSKKKQRFESSGETTVMLNNIVSAAEKNQKKAKKAFDFSDYEAWFGESKEIDKLGKLTKKIKKNVKKQKGK
ncbi:hypothetical protein SCLARK_001440 [Spiroplasma clarkii]|uniref:hypothetical protein n=1 Tax=Spiroplasma clarkii TaxID=2139 RepID=UPI000B57500D|nr:hypothetical protein [Spiroplasma clarkii]ARU91961.1 hypothetical protein SCLARK_001440 [Spiroplasma clarkii]